MSWHAALERPGPTFLAAYVRRLGELGGARGATVEALAFLGPRIGWAEYGAHVPLGLVGLRAVWRLRGVLAERSFHRALGLQLAMAAREGRGPEPVELPAKASEVDWSDMATLGYKPVFALHFADLDRRLERTGQSDPLVAHVVAQVAPDRYWHRLAERRLGRPAPATAPEEALLEGGVVEAMAAVAGLLAAGGDPLPLLVAGACRRLQDATRELQGQTSWLLVYLAALAEARPSEPHPWLQAAALVNFFPGLEPEAPAPQAREGELLDAVLDGEDRLASALAAARGAEALPVLAEAATRNDPAFNHGRQVLAAAAVLDLATHLPEACLGPLAAALATSLARGQGSCDQALLLERLLGP